MWFLYIQRAISYDNLPFSISYTTSATFMVETLWDTVKRFENPHNYYVDLSQKLWDIKQELLRAGSL